MEAEDFWDDKLLSFFIYENSQGPRLYSKQPVTDLSGAAEGFLQRYQTYTEDSQLSKMKSLLDTVDVNSNTTRRTDDLSLEVEVKYNHMYLTWSNTLNEEGYSRLSLKFDKWGLSKYYDDRSFYKLGSSEVNISQEEAHNIALKSVKSYQYTSEDEEKVNFNILEELIYSRFDFLNRTDRFVKYPIWIVDLPLSEFYAGGVSYIEVMLWADSGEVISIEALGGGYAYEEPSSTPTPSTENTQLDNNGAVPSEAYIVAACVAIAVSITVVAVAFKKKSK